MEIYKQREYDVRNIIDDISGLSGLFENYVEEVNKFIDYLLEDTKEINTLQQELQRKDNIINGIKKEVNEQLEEYEKGKEEYKKYGNLEDYAKGLRSAYISILDKIKELEKSK